MTYPQQIYNNTNAICIAHGFVGEMLGKTAHGLLIHSKVFNIVALVDKNKAGQDTSKICPGVTKQVPIYSNIDYSIVHSPKVAILIGDPTPENTEELKQCICYGMDIINSSFTFLKNNPELVKLSASFATKLIDLRDFKKTWRVADGSIINIKAKVVLVTGTDCGLGKRTAAYELMEEAQKRGIKAAFAATGQTGLMLGCDGGIVVDAIPSNFLAGAIEEMLMEIDSKGFDIIFLEGQASLMHFGWSNVISLLHAGNPHAIVLVHDPSREYHATFENSPIFKMCSLQREIEIIENLYLPNGNRFKIVAIPTRGEHNIEQVKKLSQLPVADVRKPGGPSIILNAVIQHLKKEYNWEPCNLPQVPNL